MDEGMKGPLLTMARLHLYYTTVTLPIRLSFYAPLSSAVYDIDSSPKSFKTIGYKYLEKKYEGV